MIKNAVKYYSLEDLWNNIKKLGDKRMYIAGGTDFVITHYYNGIDLDCIVDISDIKELLLIKESKKDIFVGACVKISELSRNNIIKKYIPALIKSIDYYASHSIRNIATLGGNLANGSPCADGVMALMASRAKVVLNLYNKRRIVDIYDIFVGPKKVLLKKDELIEGFLVPKWEHKSFFIKSMPRKIFGISKAGLCLCIDIKNNIIKDVSIACSSVGPKVLLAKKTMDYLKGKKLNGKVINEASKIILNDISPIDDHRSNADYRKHIISVYTKRALESFL